MTYTSDFNYLVTVKDSREGTTTYIYDTVKGVLNSVTDANGNTTTYTYDPNTDALLSTSGQTSSTANPLTNSYTYTNDRLTSITHNGFSYGFNYDSFGRVTSTTVAGQTLISHTYNANGTLNKSTYGNGDYVNYSYDSLDRVVSNSYNGVKTFEYDYNKEGLVTKETDYENNVVKNYEYDFARRLIGETSSNGLCSSYTYDERNNIKNLYVTKGNIVLADSEYTYKEDGLIDSFKMPLIDNAEVTYTHDSLNRVTQEHIALPMEDWGAVDTDFFAEYTYVSNGTNQTGLISEVRYHAVHQQEPIYIDPFKYEWEVKALRYTYDANGNITTVSEVVYDDDENELDVNLLHTYTYDGLNQLIRHDDNVVKKSYRYQYVNGVLRYTYVYPYSTGTLGSAEDLIARFCMGNWSDQITQFDNKSITYDEIGNVISYDGFTYDWEKGRQLSSITSEDLNMSFEYNSSGLRTQKTVNSETKQYFYSGELLIGEYDGLEYLTFTYAPNGEPVGFTITEEESNEILGYYIYLKNIQGDIIGLINYQGELECTYSYDAWGKFLGAYDENDNEITNPYSAALRNPLRYRGYYYDDETSLYYLNSRYYNPEWGVFISADDANYIGADGTILAYNLYSYCGNNPIIRKDSSGYAWETVFDVVSLAASAVEVTMNPTDLTAWVGLVGDTVDLIPFVTGVGETIKVLRTSSKLVDKIDGTVDTYKNLRKINKGSGNEVHHIIEKRLIDSLKIDNTNDMLSITLDKKTHQAYTSAWRKQLPYKGIYDAQDILKAAAIVYSNSAKLLGVVLYSLL